MSTLTLPNSKATVAVRDEGTGPPWLLLHAFPLDSSMWTPQIAALSPSARVIAPDLPGFGASPPVDGWTIDSAAALVAELLDALNVTAPVTLCGLSMGGYVALAFARRFPQRLARLILADTKAEPDDDATKAGRAKMIETATAGGASAVMAAMLPKLLGDITHAIRPDVVATVKAMGERQSTTAITAALAALRDRPDARPGLASIAAPTTVIVGAEDTVTPLANAKLLADSIPGATLHVIDTAGHLANLEHAAAFNAAMTNVI